MNRLTAALIVAVVALGWLWPAEQAQAQAPFFSNAGVALYNPIISIIPSGTRLVVGPTVSADRKYVTIAMNPQVRQVITITNQPIFLGAGPAGGAVPAPIAPALGTPPRMPSMAGPPPGGAVLNASGMIWIAPP